MRFKVFLETIATFNVPINKLYGWLPKMEETYADIKANRLSHSTGDPVILSRLDTPRGAFFIIDGYHRIVEAALAGAASIQATLNPYLPRIERTGGAHSQMVSQKAPIAQLVSRLKLQ